MCDISPVQPQARSVIGSLTMAMLHTTDSNPSSLCPHGTTFRDKYAERKAGVISGANPTEVSTSDPLRLWVIQLTLVVVTTQILSIILRIMRQPRVISEVISGVILGPSIMGRVPGFSNAIFPTDSLPYLTLTANIGLVLFLFLVGLETDTRVISRNVRYSVGVAAGGMILPFGLGTGVASLVYNEFVDKETVSFGNFLLFVGVAFACVLSHGPRTATSNHFAESLHSPFSVASLLNLIYWKQRSVLSSSVQALEMISSPGFYWHWRELCFSFWREPWKFI